MLNEEDKVDMKMEDMDECEEKNSVKKDQGKKGMRGDELVIIKKGAKTRG